MYLVETSWRSTYSMHEWKMSTPLSHQVRGFSKTVLKHTMGECGVGRNPLVVTSSSQTPVHEGALYLRSLPLWAARARWLVIFYTLTQAHEMPVQHREATPRITRKLQPCACERGTGKERKKKTKRQKLNGSHREEMPFFKRSSGKHIFWMAG